MNKFVHAAVLSTAMLVAGQAGAATISLDLVNASWENHSGGQFVEGEGTNVISWGADPMVSPGKRSSYEFAPFTPLPAVVVEGAEFELGDFTHHNFVIPSFESAITGVDLVISLDLTIDGNPLPGQGPFTFVFAHVETDNNCTGVGCSNDLITISNSDMPVEFVVGNRAYSLDVLGFKVGTGLVNTFSTREKRDNSAPIVARIVGRDLEVPAPESLPLLGLGLLGLGSLLRRRA